MMANNEIVACIMQIYFLHLDYIVDGALAQTSIKTKEGGYRDGKL